jgi:DNA-directed RNA polymerase specialized sigma24 family protein
VAVDETEFSEFFASQYAALCWLGLLLTGDRAEGEELAQEALVRTWWRWKLVRRPDDPASYARRVLVNRRRSLLRRAGVEARYLARSRPEDLVVPAGDARLGAVAGRSGAAGAAAGGAGVALPPGPA